jgi:hypothetical protein
MGWWGSWLCVSLPFGRCCFGIALKDVATSDAAAKWEVVASPSSLPSCHVSLLPPSPTRTHESEAKAASLHLLQRVGT